MQRFDTSCTQHHLSILARRNTHPPSDWSVCRHSLDHVGEGEIVRVSRSAPFLHHPSLGHFDLFAVDTQIPTCPSWMVGFRAQQPMKSTHQNHQRGLAYPATPSPAGEWNLVCSQISQQELNPSRSSRNKCSRLSSFWVMCNACPPDTLSPRLALGDWYPWGCQYNFLLRNWQQLSWLKPSPSLCARVLMSLCACLRCVWLAHLTLV